MKKIKLLPCPFCGGEAEFVEDFDGFIGIPIYHIKCRDCDCKKSALEDETVIDYWNTRKPIKRIVEQLKKKIHPLHNVNWNAAIEESIDIVKWEGGVDNG